MRKLLVTFLFLLLTPLFAATTDSNGTNAHVFTRTGCPYCAQTISLLEMLRDNGYSELIIHEYDMAKKPAYAVKLNEFASAYGAVDTSHVPITFIDKKTITGFDEGGIHSSIENCHVSECVDPAKFVEDYFKNNPNSKPNNVPQNGNREFLGWLILGVVVVGLGLVFVNKKL